MLMRKKIAGTETVDGVIPHLRVIVGSQILDAPVCVRVMRAPCEETRLRPIVNEQGRYVHALPGGATIAGSYKR